MWRTELHTHIHLGVMGLKSMMKFDQPFSILGCNIWYNEIIYAPKILGKNTEWLTEVWFEIEKVKNLPFTKALFSPYFNISLISLIYSFFIFSINLVQSDTTYCTQSIQLLIISRFDSTFNALKINNNKYISNKKLSYISHSRIKILTCSCQVFYI